MRRTGLVGRALAAVVVAMSGTTALAITAASPAAAAPLPLPIRVDFAPDGTVLAGWTLDFGEAYGADGHEYGWVHPGTSTPLSLVGNAAARSYSGPDPELGTLMHMQGDEVSIPGGVSAEGAWEAAVPAPGSYTVTVAVGDIDFRDSRHWVSIEGQAGVVDFDPSPPAAPFFHEVTRTVEVTDGRLTLDARGGRNTKILSVEITAGALDGRAFVQNMSVGHNATNVFLNSRFQLYLDRALNLGTVTPTTVTLATLAGASVTAPVSASGSTITIQPSPALAPSIAYKLSVNGVEGSDGTIVVPFESVFTTGTVAGADPAAGPADIEVAPARVAVDGIANGAAEPAGTVVVRNVGTSTLTVSSSVIVGSGVGAWLAPNAALSIASGVAATIPVEFAPASPGPNTGASLRLVTNDADEGTVDVPLRGLGTLGTYGDLEPSAQWVLDTLGYTIVVGDPDPTTPALPGGSGLLGEEVVARAFRAAQSGSAVTVEPVAVFGPQNVDPVMRLGWYPIGQPVPTNALFTISGDDAQELLPLPAGATSFSPGTTAFGLVASSPFGGNKPMYTQDSLNVWGSDPGTPHNIRAYPLRQAGTLVPNAYLFAVEGFAEGDDFQDLMFIARNVQIVSEIGEVGVQPAELVMDATIGTTSSAQPVTVSNSGITPLAIGSITLSGPDAGSFVCSGCFSGPPTSIAPGPGMPLSVQFSPTGTAGSRHALLRILTDDGDEATVDVGLHGLATAPGGGPGNEPPLDQVVNVLSHGVDVGGPFDLPTTPAHIGDEVEGELFVRASTGPVTVSAVARYAATGAVSFGWYPDGSATLNTAATIGADENQTMNPITTPAGPVPFTPGGGFGLFINRSGALAYSEDVLNAGSGHRMRVYPRRDRAGIRVANSYLVAIDNDDSNGDYQDLVLQIDNVLVDDGAKPPKPVGLVPTPTASGISLDWADVSAPDLAGYRVYRDIPELTTAPLLTSFYVDTTAVRGIVYAYGVSAVDVWGNESDPAIEFAKRPLIPVAGFNVSAPPPPTLPATVTFTDASSGEPTTWAWDFQSDGTVDATTANATFTYTSPGPHAVTLSVSNISGSDVETKTVVVGSVNDFTAPPKPAGLVPTPTASGISLDWADVSAPDLAGYRVYRHGQELTTAPLLASSYADPTAELGIVYPYGVTAVDVWGNESDPTFVFAKRPSIPVAGFNVSAPSPPTLPATVTFTDASSGEPTAWAWDFQSDGVVDATTPTATFVYSSPGTYAVTLTVSNITGADVETKSLVVSAGGGGGPGGPIGPGDPGVVCGGAEPWTVGMPAVGPTTFHPVTPGRILDTRDGTGAPAGKLDDGCTLALDVTGLRGIPADGVRAVSLNVTATEALENGYVTVYPCAAGRPPTSSLNTRPGRDIANLVTVPVGADGLVCFYTYRSVHLLADVAGWFGDGDGGSRMTGLAPARVLDTRDGTGAPASPVAAGGVVSVQVAGWGGVPATGVSAVVLNLTATESTGPGYLSAYPCDQDVYASALNYVAGQTVANHVLVPLDSAGRFCISSYAQSDVIADVLGYYGAPGGLEGSRFTPLTPGRIVDTRGNVPAGATGLDAGNVLPVDVLGSGGVPGAGVDAVMFNLTSADAGGPGYLTAFPCGGVPPNASNVNHVASAAASNLVTVPLGTGGQVCIFSYADSDVLVDVAGYFSP